MFIRKGRQILVCSVIMAKEPEAISDHRPTRVELGLWHVGAIESSRQAKSSEDGEHDVGQHW